MPSPEYTTDEMMTVEAARQLSDGDVCFVGIGLPSAAANLARHLGVDPEAALRATNAKFERRFAHIEDRLSAQGREPADASLEAMEALWVEAKQAERAGG